MPMWKYLSRWGRIIVRAALLAALMGWPDSAASQATQPGIPTAFPPYRPGAVLVKLAQTLGAAPSRARLMARGWRVREEIPQLGLASVETAVGRETAAAAALRGQPGVLYAEPDYSAHALGAAAQALPPSATNDPYLAQQWAIDKMAVPAAWRVTTGSVTITIAIVDTGLDLAHPDLASKVWTNAGEIPGNGVDDDGNGKVDDVHGWHFYHVDNGVTYDPAEDAHVQDDAGHGTHVAGIAAAAANNGIGIAGLAWGSHVLPVKVLNERGDGWYSDIAAGIVYAADNGARIINLSLGGAAASAALCEAVRYAVDKGSLVVAAAGNDAGAVNYPAACPHALAVAATDAADSHPDSSSHGPQVAVAAPGVSIYSTWYFSGLHQSGYRFETGTSMAAPQVSGVAALVRSAQPQWTPGQVAFQLERTADDLGAPSWDPLFGWGRINAARAVTASLFSVYLPLFDGAR
jgi:thermitase